MKRIVGWSIGVLVWAAPAGAIDSPNEDDRYTIENAAQESLEYARTDEPTSWINPDTGAVGTITPVATYESPDGQVCREYAIRATIGGREEQVYGTACRQPDGTWWEANSEFAQDPPPPTYSNSSTYSTGSSGYPWWWVLPSIALSATYCDDGFCIGGNYGGGYRYGYGYPGGYYPYGYYPYGYSPYGFGFSYYNHDYGHKSYRHHGYRNHYRGGHGGRRHYSGYSRGGSRGGHHTGGRSGGHSTGGRSGGHGGRSGGHSAGGRSGGGSHGGRGGGSSRGSRMAAHNR